MPPSRYIRLTEEEDARLRQIEQDPYLKPKVRLRAQVLRLSHRGSNVQTIASYTGRSEASVRRDLDRWEEQGFEGLADATAPGNPPRITAEARAFLRDRLSEEERTWNARQLAESLEESLGVGVLRPRPFVSTSSRWDTRGSVPATCQINRPIPCRSQRPKRSWRTSKRGTRRRDRPEVPRRKRLLFVSTPDVHLDEERYPTPASGEQQVGV
jgi:transposase